MGFNMMIPFVVVSFALLVAVFWMANYKVVEPIQDHIDCGYADKKVNINIAYLYVHKKTGKLSVVSVLRGTRIPHRPEYDIIDVWWEPANE